MDFQTLIETRRTVRKYSPETDVTREQILEMVRAAQEAPSWKNTETGRYYCVLSEDMKLKLRQECLGYANNDVKTEHAALIVTTFVHNHAGFQTDGTADNEIGNGWGCPRSPRRPEEGSGARFRRGTRKRARRARTITT